MRILIAIAIFCVFSSFTTAQKIYGFAEFEIKLAEDNFPFNGKLYFNHKASTFINKQSNKDEWVIKKRGAAQEYLTEEIYSDSIGHTFLTILGQAKLTIREFCEPGKPIIYEDHVSIDWNIKNEKKEVQGLQCQKATAKFRGRKYEAWFTMEVPVAFGPWKFHGLPGLIIEITDTKKEVIINLVQLSLNGVYEKTYSSNGNEDWVKLDEYYSCLDRQWKKGSEATKARFAMLQAEYPGLEIELETLHKRPATELKFK